MTFSPLKLPSLKTVMLNVMSPSRLLESWMFSSLIERSGAALTSTLWMLLVVSPSRIVLFSSTTAKT